MKKSRIEQIRTLLKENGPMTTLRISEETGISRSNVTGVIAEFRSNPGRKMRIRKAGKIHDGVGTTLSYVYELSNEPDVVIKPLVSKRAMQKPRVDYEELVDRKRIAERAAESIPFRDPMLFMTAGVSP